MILRKTKLKSLYRKLNRYPRIALKMNHPVVNRYFDTFKVWYRYRMVPRYFDIDAIWPGSSKKMWMDEVDDERRLQTVQVSHLCSASLSSESANQEDSMKNWLHLIDALIAADTSQAPGLPVQTECKSHEVVNIYWQQVPVVWWADAADRYLSLPSSILPAASL